MKSYSVLPGAKRTPTYSASQANIKLQTSLTNIESTTDILNETMLFLKENISAPRVDSVLNALSTSVKELCLEFKLNS